MANPTEHAWAQGYKTGLNGKPDSLCPFKKGMAHQAWMEGWQNGAKAHEEKQGEKQG
jgi:ribosome modulation factor